MYVLQVKDSSFFFAKNSVFYTDDLNNAYLFTLECLANAFARSVKTDFVVKKVGQTPDGFVLL